MTDIPDGELAEILVSLFFGVGFSFSIFSCLNNFWGEGNRKGGDTKVRCVKRGWREERERTIVSYLGEDCWDRGGRQERRKKKKGAKEKRIFPIPKPQASLKTSQLDKQWLTLGVSTFFQPPFCEQPLAKKIVTATGAKDYNLLQNNGRAAHQLVDHVRIRPIFPSTYSYSLSFPTLSSIFFFKNGYRVSNQICPYLF